MSEKKRIQREIEKRRDKQKILHRGFVFLFHKWARIFWKRENNDINGQEIEVDSIFMSFQTYLPGSLQFSSLFSIFTVVKMFRKRYGTKPSYSEFEKNICLQLVCKNTVFTFK